MLCILITMCLMPDFDTLAWLKGWCDVSFQLSTEGIVSSVFFFCLLLIKTLYAAQQSCNCLIIILLKTVEGTRIIKTDNWRLKA